MFFSGYVSGPARRQDYGHRPELYVAVHAVRFQTGLARNRILNHQQQPCPAVHNRMIEVLQPQ